MPAGRERRVARLPSAGRRRPTRARRTARPPRRCRGTRCGGRRATRPGVRQAPARPASSLGAAEPSAGTMKMRVRACRSASGSGSLAYATWRAVGRPDRAGCREVARDDAPRLRADPRGSDPQVAVPIEDAAAVETPVDTPEHAGERRLPVDAAARRRSAAPARSRSAAGVVRPARARTRRRRARATSASRRRRRRARRGAPDGRAGTARARPSGEKAGALSSTGPSVSARGTPAAALHAPDPRAVVVPLDGPAGVRDQRAVTRDGGIGERDLAPDEARGRQRHRRGGYCPHEPHRRAPARALPAAAPLGHRRRPRRARARGLRDPLGPAARARTLVDRGRGARRPARGGRDRPRSDGAGAWCTASAGRRARRARSSRAPRSRSMR